MREKGFTLIELMIVIAIIVIIAAIAIPNLLSARVSSNEVAAVATMRTLISAQAQFQTSGKIDSDNNGVGEHAYWVDMANAKPAIMSASFALTNSRGQTSRGGYFYSIFIPDNLGAGMEELPDGGGRPGTVDPVLAESHWCAYAWPKAYGKSGNRTFFVNQAGEILQTDAEGSYSGTALHPGSAAAFQNAGSITGAVALGMTGNDGHFWKMSG